MPESHSAVWNKKTNPEGLLETSTHLARLYEIQGKSDSTIKYLKMGEYF